MTTSLAATLGLALLGALAGRACGPRRRVWAVAGGVGLAAVGLVAAAAREPTLSFVPPFSWVALGQREVAVMAFAIPFLLVTLAARLPRACDARAVRVFAGVAVSLFLFLRMPMQPVALGEIACGATKRGMRPDGVRLQSTDYTCGPASAVTALAVLGVQSDEADLAWKAGTSERFGTASDCLALAIEELHGADGILCEYRRFDSIDDLKGHEPVIVDTKYAFLMDHAMVVLEVRPDEVVLGDPLEGRRVVPRGEFEAIWRGRGIVVARTSDGRR